MVVLGVVKRWTNFELCRDRRKALRLQFILKMMEAGLSGRKLLGGFGINAGSILGTHIVALAHALSWIVALPELCQEGVEGYGSGVPNHQNNFGVAGLSGADLLIGWVG